MSRQRNETPREPETVTLPGLIVRVCVFVLGVLGQIYTAKETVFLFLDLAAGALDAKFYVSLIILCIMFPFSLWLILRGAGSPAFVELAMNVYALAISATAAAYYFAIFANYKILYLKLITSMPSALSNAGSNGVNWTPHFCLTAVYALPLVGAAVFALGAGRAIAGIASIPILASFLYGCTLLASSLRSEEFGADFQTVEAPRLIMTGALFFVGMMLFSRFLPRKLDA